MPSHAFKVKSGTKRAGTDTRELFLFLGKNSNPYLLALLSLAVEVKINRSLAECPCQNAAKMHALLLQALFSKEHLTLPA